MTAESISRAWSWRKAVTRSDLMPTTRHVLLTLSLHMNEHGEGCYPPVENLVEETGLSKRAVLEHLNRAIEAGWLVRQELGLRGRRWRRSEYQPAWPGRDVIGDMADPVGDDGRSPPPADKVVTEDARGGDPDDTEVVTEGYRVSEESIQESTKSPVEREARAGEGKKTDPRPWERDAAFMRCVKAWWTQDGLANAWREWQAMEADVREAAERGIPIYLAKHQTRSSRCALSTYLHERPFQFYPKPADAAERPATAELLPRSMAWCGVFFGLAMAPTPANVRKARGMLQDADFTKVTHVRCEEVPGAEALAKLVKIERDGDQFRAWRKALANRRDGTLWLKPEAFGEWLWVPSEWPPGWVHDPPQDHSDEVGNMVDAGEARR